MRRAADPDMHFPGPRFAQIRDSGTGRGSPHNRVVHHDHPLALHRTTDQVQLHPDVEVPDQLAGLDKGPSDVMVPHKSLLERDARMLGVSHRGVSSRIRNRYHNVRLHRVHSGQLPTHANAGVADIAAA